VAYQNKILNQIEKKAEAEKDESMSSGGNSEKPKGGSRVPFNLARKLGNPGEGILRKNKQKAGAFRRLLKFTVSRLNAEENFPLNRRTEEREEGRKGG